jgi:hypothetical protein
MARPTRSAMTTRGQALLERIYHALGENAVHERWIDDRHGALGLAEPGIITISPATLVPVIIHECLHRAFPERSERATDCLTSYLYHRMSDEETKRLWEAYARKRKIIRRPTTSE